MVVTQGSFENIKKFAKLQNSLYFISCGEGEDHHQFLNRNLNRHNRRLFRRLNNINHNQMDSQQIIPRQNVRLRLLFDRVNQEIEKFRRKKICYKLCYF